MAETVDASGLSCPQPVLMTLDKIKAMGQGRLEVLVDTASSKENVSRAAKSQGWKVSGQEETKGGFKLVLEK
jgi:tRNA 2-thiouridine synthesizing protein A